MLREVSLKHIKMFRFEAIGGTGKSQSEVLILESTNPQYDKRLFID